MNIIFAILILRAKKIHYVLRSIKLEHKSPPIRWPSVSIGAVSSLGKHDASAGCQDAELFDLFVSAINVTQSSPKYSCTSESAHMDK